MTIVDRRDLLRMALGLSAGWLCHSSATAAPQASVGAVTWLAPGDEGFSAAKTIYNATVRLTPALVATCHTEDGVREAMAKAAEKDLPVAIKSGGHSFEGYCLNDGGLVIDVSSMNDMRLDVVSGTLTAGAGCRLMEVNQMLLGNGRLLPSGSCATVGLSGLTLGGGYGFFARQFGLTCDHLSGLRLIDGEGRARDSDNEPELLWACRGGGNGNFGVVTELRFKTRPAPQVFRATKLHGASLTEPKLTEILKAWFEVSAGLTENAFSAFVLNGNTLNILVTTTGSMRNRGMVAFIRRLVDLGLRQVNSRDVSPAQALPRYYGQPGPVSFKNGSGGYYRSFEDLAPALPGIIHELFTVPGLIFQINTLGGAIARGPDSAYPHRAYPWLGEWQSYWEAENRRDRVIAGALRMREHLEKNGITRHYVNYPDSSLNDWMTAYYDQSYSRLQALKRQLDPQNRIRHPQSVRG